MAGAEQKTARASGRNGAGGSTGPSRAKTGRASPQATPETAPAARRSPRVNIRPTKNARSTTASREAAPAQAVERVDTSYLESLIGYNARRAALAVIAVFLERLAPHGLRPVDFSILSLITHNPGITARQLCHALGILPPNMVGVVNGFEKRGLIERRPHPSDRRAQGLHLTAEGIAFMAEAERTAKDLEQDVAHRLTAQEQRTLMQLLQKIYL